MEGGKEVADKDKKWAENWIAWNIRCRDVWLKQQVWIYTEDDWVAEVKILEDLSDRKYLKYRLKVIKTIRQSKFYKPVRNGHEFQCFCHHKAVKYPMDIIKQETSLWMLEWKNAHS